MSRPYRHVDTETLKQVHKATFARIQENLKHWYTALASIDKRELDLVAKELDRRKNGAQYQQ